jgi:hypothetical protein
MPEEIPGGIKFMQVYREYSLFKTELVLAACGSAISLFLSSIIC